MANPLELTVDLRALRRFNAKFPVAFNKEIKPAVTSYYKFLRARIISEQLSGRPGLNKVTGKLRKSLVIRQANPLPVLVFDSPIASVHDQGKTITAKGGWLWIPVGRLRSSSGRIKHSSVNWKKTFRIPTRGRDGWVVMEKRLGRRAAPIFVLKRSVDIPKRLDLAGIVLRTQGIAALYINQGIDRAIARAQARGK